MAAHDLPVALSAWIRAADEAVAVLAPAEALAHYDQALQLLPAVPPAARPAGLDAVDLTMRAATAAGAAGEQHRAVALATAAVALATAGDDRATEAAARARLAQLLYEADRHAEAQEQVVAVRELVGEGGPSPLRVWAAAIEARIPPVRNDLELTRRLLEPALEEARALGLAAAEADMLITLAIREGESGVVEDAATRLSQARRLALAAGDPAVALRAVFNLGINRIDSGDLAGARSKLEHGLAEAERAGLALTVYGIESLQLLLHTLVLAGEWDEALAIHARGCARAPALQRDQLAAPLLRVHVARDPLAALEATARLLPLAEAEPWSSHTVLAARADAMRWVGDHEGALDVVRHCMRLKAEDGDPWDLGQLVVLGIGVGALADGAAAAAVREDVPTLDRLRAEGAELLAHARAVAKRGEPRLGELGPEGRAWLARAEAEFARLEGRDAPERWEQAVQAFEFGQRYEVARSRRYLAEALVARGDRDGAARQALLARETASSLQARPLREAVDALARRARLDLGGGPVTASVLTPREQEVMRLVAQGLTNRQIGRQLYISEKTASVHVSNVLAKLGAGSRTEAVAIAHRRGLLADLPTQGRG
jgi:DNA-binding CsgD family transcriptional regulator